MQSRNRDTDIENKHTDTKVGKARGWMNWGIENDIYTFYSVCYRLRDFPGGSDGKASVYNAGDPGSIPGLGRSPAEGNGNPLQYYCLENLMDRGAW